MAQRKKEANPFSFFSGEGPDEDIFKDFDPGPPKKKDPKPIPPKTTPKDDNPFSFFTAPTTNAPPQPKPKKKDTDFFDMPSSTLNKSKGASEDSFFDPPSLSDNFFDEPDPLPSFGGHADLPFPDIGRPKPKNQKLEDDEPPRPPLQQVLQSTPRNNPNSEIEKYKRAAEKAEALALGYEEKLKQANKLIEKMRQKEKEDEKEMENALKLIERKLVESQKRAEKAEDENERLQKIIKKLQNQSNSGHNHHQCNYDWQALQEKTNFAVGSMSQMATQSETHINGLLTMAKDFHLLMETLKSLGNISAAHNEPNPYQ